MNFHLVMGLAMGGLALLLAISMGWGAIGRLRMWGQNNPTYLATGGPVFAVFQLGCAGLALIAGMLIIGLAFRIFFL